jgi:hypothetical protein
LGARIGSLRIVLPVTVIVAFFAMLVVGFLSPMYTDEVASKGELARTLVEGGRLVTLLPQCKGSWISNLPLSWMPGAVYYHVVFSRVGLLGIKLSAFVLALVWFGGVARFLFGRTKDRALGLRRIASYLALHAAGVLPLAFLTARAEPTIILSLAAYVAFPLAWSIATRRTLIGRAAVTAGFVLITSIVFLTHPKILYFTPVVLLSTALTFSVRRPISFAIAAIFVALTIVQTYSGAKSFVSCPESPDVAKALRDQTLDLSKAKTEPGVFLGKALADVRTNFAFVSDSMALDAKLPWLPVRPTSSHSWPERVAIAGGRAWLLVFLYVAPLSVVVVATRALRRRASRSRALFALALTGGVFLLVGVSASWAFYNSALVVAALGLATTLTVSIVPFAVPVRFRKRMTPYIRGATYTGHVAASFALVAAFVATAPGALRIARLDTTLIPDAPAWVPAFGYSKERERIRAQADRCGIKGDGATHLVVDDATFFAFDDLRLPLHLVYVTDTTMWGGDRQRLLDVIFLAELEAPGVVSRCVFLPSMLADKAKREGDYCCLAPPISYLHSIDPPGSLDFGQDGGSNDMMLFPGGWSFQEEYGRWTVGPSARFVFAYPGPLPRRTAIHLRVFAPLIGERHQQRVEVLLNGVSLGEIVVGEDDNDATVDHRLPVAPIDAFRRVNIVELKTPDHRSPAELGVGTDSRPLGINVHRFWFD